jgi:hypothetical protein
MHRFALAVCLLIAACESRAADSAGSSAAATGAQPYFTEITAEAGFGGRLERPIDASYFMPDSMGPGCALFDCDGDGDLDAYLVQGLRDAEGRVANPGGRNRLLKQEHGHFVDASASSGAAHEGYGMGVATGDVDNDGDVDLFITNFGPSALLLNCGDGTFDDATARAGFDAEPRDTWGASAGFFDYDGDGWLDLYVSRYLAYDAKVEGKNAAGQSDYPSPAQFKGLADSLYHNDGDGTFTDVSRASGIGATPGKGLGVAFTDLDGDGRVDVFVANDGEANFAWIQRENGRFENRAYDLGLAVNSLGRPQANMGVALGDCDGDGDLDLFVTHLVQETSTLFRRDASGRFADGTAASGLGGPSLDFTGFATAFADLDLDGDLDLLAINGRILRRVPHPRAKLSPHWTPYGEPNQLFLNDGRGRFAEAAEACGAFCAQAEVGRGLALGDLDDDGDLDALVSNGDGTFQLFRNDAPRQGHYLIVRALDSAHHRDAYGARVEVAAAGRTFVREITATQGYLSSSDPRAHFGLGAVASVEAIRVHWPDGLSETFGGGAVDVVRTLQRGTGRP